MKAHLPGSGVTFAGSLARMRRPAAREFLQRIWAVDLRTTMFAAALGCAIVIAIGVPLAASLNIWLDEAFTMHSTSAGVIYAWQQAIAFEMQPPVYFVLEAAWRMFNEGSIAFARVPSVIFAAAAVAIIVFGAHRIAPRVPPVAVALTTALNPLVIWAAVELRLYALVFLIGAALAWLFYEAFLVDRPARAERVCYTIVAVVGLYTQYYVGFVLLAHGVTLLFFKRAAVRPFAVAMAIVAAAFIPFVHIALTHVAFSGSSVSHLSFGGVLHHMIDAIFVFLLPHELWWHGLAKLAGFASTAALCAAFVLTGSPMLPQPARGFILAWFAAIAVFIVAFSFSGAPFDLLRHVTVMAPPSLLVAYLLLSSVTRRVRFFSYATATMFAVFAGTTLWGRYHPPLLKVGDWQRVTAAISSDDRSTPVAVFPADLTLLLTTYQSNLRPTPIPGPMPFTLDYDHVMTLNDESSVARVLDPIWNRSARLWVVTTGPCTQAHVDYDYHCGYLQAYLDRRYRVIRSLTFSGALAELYVRRLSPTAPESLNGAN